ncbi:hypothetical protein ACFO9Q_14765 [Paenibacillus sp. GCM10023252]|uniref:hypothetical protein n=1 Tax=Paenibacillus sp. GCM10023252 TaxID=3252649 RepID=UPI003612097E
MGTNMYCFVEESMYRDLREKRVEKWISVDKWTKNSTAILYPEHKSSTWQVESEDMIFTDRNYGLFAILANQRNSEGMPYICEPRGLPDDVSPEITLQLRLHECYTTTWFTIHELLEYNWDQVFQYEDETMEGEKIIETVSYRECGNTFLKAIQERVGRKDPSRFRILIGFNH